ncbi:hypothetical protein OG401_20975 [Kitasatospora purpeofusca]|uniref:hypothetical protein n=1 Tax=Kitasatospora purpeofusca TaxID=67352 RepID=UPI002259AE74|nr:hypothetical protein [Kitasatospora purpeofusca]MCX4686754.1 hypothetical protein [Kitasatospora purpeofusca]
MTPLAETGVLQVDALAAWATALGAVLALLALLWRTVRRLHAALEAWSEDWQGTPARPGVAARPGVMERLATIEHELGRNSGSSLRDAVDRIEDAVRELQDR